jgi:hydrogenase maturation protease
VSHRVLVAGLGNVLMGDDAIGPYCARHLMAHYQFPPQVEVADLGTPGLDLALHLSAVDVVLLIDALRGIEQDTIAVYDRAALCDGRHLTRLDTHSLAVAESIFIARLAGDRPFDVRLIGLAGVSFEHGTRLSPKVRARIPSLIQAVLAELTARNVRWTRRARPLPLNAWWE